MLDAPLGEVLQGGRLCLARQHDGRVDIVHHDQHFPLCPEGVDSILGEACAGLLERGDAHAARELEALHQGWGAARRSGDREKLGELRLQGAQLAGRRETVARALDAVLAGYDPGSAPGRLFALLRRQHYRLGYWRAGDHKRNYRRFFDIDELVCVRNEDPSVAEAGHQCVRRLIAEGVIDGLRVDHVDGLRDPGGYLDWLHRRLAPRYLLVEKILAADETLPEAWPVDGTTGYEFLNAAARLFVDPSGLDTLRDDAPAPIGDDSFADVLWRSKRDVLDGLFSREMDALMPSLERAAESDAQACDLPPCDLRAALAALTAAMPVYRTYMRDDPPGDADLGRLRSARRDASARRPALRTALDCVCRLLIDGPCPGDESVDGEIETLRAGWQLITGPAAAKGLEDTALYRDVALTALNEVGGEPLLPDDPVAALHDLNVHRQKHCPKGLNATTTHDTKRSEDVRARIAALSELPDAWTKTLQRWRRMNAPLRAELPEGPAPDPAMEQLLYQTLVGTWPLAMEFDRDAYTDRIRGYAVKAAREAKLRTDWRAVNEAYEDALEQFVESLLDAGRNGEFTDELAAWATRTAAVGAVTGLAQTLLKCTAPGVPDIYQGSELWDLRLVDPDNRGPVDFRRRSSVLQALAESVRQGVNADLARELTHGWRDGRIKLYALWRALAERALDPALFDAGAYLPLQVHPSVHEAGGAARLCAFARRTESRWALIAVPRLVAPYVRAEPLGIDADAWMRVEVALPAGAPDVWRDALTSRRLDCDGRIPASELFAGFPAAVLLGPGDMFAPPADRPRSHSSMRPTTS